MFDFNRTALGFRFNFIWFRPKFWNFYQIVRDFDQIGWDFEKNVWNIYWNIREFNRKVRDFYRIAWDFNRNIEYYDWNLRVDLNVRDSGRNIRYFDRKMRSWDRNVYDSNEMFDFCIGVHLPNWLPESQLESDIFLPRIQVESATFFCGILGIPLNSRFLFFSLEFRNPGYPESRNPRNMESRNPSNPVETDLK